MAILVDTGPLYALSDRDDQYHNQVESYVASCQESLIVPSPVVPEVCYLLREHLTVEAELHFLRSLAAQELVLEHPTSNDLKRVIEILEQYRESEFGMVDACIMAMAERLKIQVILTLDRRDFGIIRPKHCKVFRLAPEMS